MINLLGAFVGPVTDIISKAVPDKDKAAALAHEISTMAENHAQQIALAQIEVNKTEAASAGIYKGGWRPFLGWTCGVAFAYHFVLQPFLTFGFSYMGLTAPDLPSFDMGSLMTVLMGMLGLGGLRTYEKQKGLTK